MEYLLDIWSSFKINTQYVSKNHVSIITLRNEEIEQDNRTFQG